MIADPDADALVASDDLHAAFQIDGAPVRGRIARLGPATVDVILNRHAYPFAVAVLLGEAITLAALVGGALKFDGKLIIQAQGSGPVSFVVAEYRTNGSLRGYAHFDAERLPRDTLDADALLGTGTFAMTIDQGPDTERYQGVVALEGRSIAACAEAYFHQSEQVPTRIRLGCGQWRDGESRPQWRSGGILLQQFAADAARGDASDAFETAAILLATVTDEELASEEESAGEVLFKLFHEQGVRLSPGAPLEVACTCSVERVRDMLRQFSGPDSDDMRDDDGVVRARCEYCNHTFAFSPDDLGP